MIFTTTTAINESLLHSSTFIVLFYHNPLYYLRFLNVKVRSDKALFLEHTNEMEFLLTVTLRLMKGLCPEFHFLCMCTYFITYSSITASKKKFLLKK